MRDFSPLISSAVSALLRPLIHRLDKAALAKYSGNLAFTGLRARVAVHFQDYAIPHVFADNEDDLFFAQGFLHAQERLWQMESMRRFLSGRIAKILPLSAKNAVENDYFMRLIGIGQSARSCELLLDETIRRHLDAYAAGVNSYIEQCGRKLPWEFRLLRYTPEPWQPLDSLVIGKGFALLLSTALYTRLNCIALAQKLAPEPEKLRALWPDTSPREATITRALWSGTEDLWRFTSGSWATTPWHSTGHGSNNWAVAARRSSTGHALLCNDPHLRFGLPAMFYLMHLRAEASGYKVWGASIPGLPYVHLGHNSQIAWGVTAALCDDVELYREDVHRVDGRLYRAANDWLPFGTREEVFNVRGHAPVKRTIRTTRHGPVISDFDQTQNQEGVIALRWIAHEPSQEFRAAYGVNRARNWQEFLDALTQHSAPCLNYVYADRANNIGYALAGKVPQRAGANTRLVVDGSRDDNEWHGFIPFAELPRLYNPPDGMVASANNRIVGGNYPHSLAQFAEPSHRIRRIEALLQADPRLTLQDMAAIQMDTLSLHAQETVQTLSEDLTRAAELHPELADMVARLLTWDGNCQAQSVEASLFHVWHHRMMANLLTPTLGEALFRSYVEILNQCIEPPAGILAQPDSLWFAQCSRQEIVARSLQEAVEALADRFGVNPSRWSWGRLHRLRLQHALGRYSLLGGVVNLGPFASPGDGMTVNAGNYQHSNPYDHFIGAALRMIVATGDWSASGFVIAGGQSGHPASPHYRDQLELWRRGQTVKFGLEDIRPTGDCLIISPC